SSDGLEIPAYLTVPQGSTGKNLPAVILVHGGPKGPRDNWGYNAEAQFLANRGYAVLQPNFRASGGYGKAFLNAGDLQWGKLMQDDLTWGVKYLVELGVAHPDKVVIMGGSYGGYATLAGLAFTPDLYAAGVDIVGPSNLFTLLSSVPAYWEAGRAFLYGMVGDPRTEDGKARIREASPLFSADRIKKPLLIIQGANDPRVKKAEADQIVIALREKGDKVSYLLADDEGHGFAKPVNKMAMYAEVERFLAEVVGGRYQREMPGDVARRLEELRVDVSTVVFTPKEEVASTEEIPVISTEWKEDEASYDVSMEVQGQKFPMEMTRTVRFSEGKWMIREETNGPMGQVQDEFWYDTSFKPLQRVINQMGQNISMQFQPRSVSLNLMGQSMEIAMEKAYLPDGPGMDMLVAGMPLRAGYSVVFDMPDLNALKPKQVRLRVTGEEDIEGRKTLVVEIAGIENENDRMTLWIDTDNGWALRTEQLLPAMMGAKMTMHRK
ncbi:MAG: S9 family peptidase, partial [Saprospiraceae bacterium]|nr:S9 family peptidase [Saprospiraceae bacterium]